MAERGSAAAASGFNTSRIWLAAAIVGIVTGGVLKLAGQEDAADIAWAITTVVGIIPMAREVVTGLLRREPGVDVIALLAMLGALALEEYLAGAVIALMLSTGEALEAYADRRAHRELSALLERAPRTVNRYEGDDLVTRPIEEVAVGDRLMVKTGEVVPVDGVMLGDGVLDESALTGESRPVERPMGDLVRSGAVNAGPAYDLRASTTAEESTYAGIVRLVKEAEQDKAPFVRLADRYATIFIPVTLVIAGGGLVVERGFHPRPHGAHGGHAVSVDPGRADRGGGRHLPRGAPRDHRQGWRRAGDDRARQGAAVRQDRHADLGHPGDRRHRGVRDARRQRGVAARRLDRPGVAARAGHRDRPRRARAQPHAGVPRRSEGAARGGDRGTRGRASRGVGQGELRGRGRAPATARQGHPPPHQPGRLLVRVRGGGRHGRGRPRDRRPDPPRLAAGDPVAAPNRDRPRDHGHGRSSRRRRVGRRRAGRRPDPVRAHARREGGGGRRRA